MDDMKLFFLPGNKTVTNHHLKEMWDELNGKKMAPPGFDDFVKFLEPHKVEARDAPTDIKCDASNAGKDVRVLGDDFIRNVKDLGSNLYADVFDDPEDDDQIERLIEFRRHVAPVASDDFCQAMMWNNIREMHDLEIKTLAPETGAEPDLCGSYAFPLMDTIPKNRKQFVLGRVLVLRENGYYDCNKHFHTLMSSYWDPRDMIEQDAFIACVKAECMLPHTSSTFAARVVLAPIHKTLLQPFQTWTQPGDKFPKVLHRELCQLGELTLWQSREDPNILFLAKRGEQKDRRRFWQVSYP